MAYIGKHRVATKHLRTKRGATGAAFTLSASLLFPLAVAHAGNVGETLLNEDKDVRITDVRSSIRLLKTKIQQTSTKVVPPTTGVKTTGFEMRWGTFHDGLDIADALGTPIYAAQAGTVIDSGPSSGYGNWIRIQAEDGTVTLYGHMPYNSLRVQVGDEVKAGEYIADMGSEGFSTGSHLHFSVYIDGKAVDPVEWFISNGVTDWHN